MAITTWNATHYAAFIKSRFPQRQIDSVVEFEKPTLQSLKKVDDLYGKETFIPLEMDQPQGYGTTLGGTAGIVASSSVNYITSSRGLRWVITRAKGYGMLQIDGETMLAAASDEGSWFRTRERETKGMLSQLGQKLEMMLWQDGTGSIGTVTADPGTGTTFTLNPIQDAINFHEGMYVQFHATSSGVPGTVRAGGPYEVTGVNYGTGVVTVGAALDAAILSSGSTDHVIRFTDTALVAAPGLRGIPAYIPATDPTDTFFGLARTLYPQKLGGHRQAWLGSIEETVKALDSSIRRVNQRPKTLWLSYANFNRLDNELGARGYRMENGGEGVFGRSSLMMSSPGGPIAIKAGPYVPETGAWLLDMDTWELHHRGGLPHIVEDDGNVALRVQSLGGGNVDDSIEVRFRWLAQLVCTNPFANGRAAIS